MKRALVIPIALFAVACARSDGAVAAPDAVVARAAAAPEAQASAKKKVTLLVSGDVWGKYARCSCPSNPGGGVARKSQLIQTQRGWGPTVVLDAGDLLFPSAGATPTAVDLAGAELLLEAAGAFGTAALGVGDRDLANGVDWLLARAKKAKVPLVSANLTRTDGSKPFESRLVVPAGSAKVGVTGLWLSDMPPPAGLAAADPVETAKAEVAALQKAGVDVVVVLAHGTPSSAREVAAVEGVDLVIPAHQGSGTTPQRVDGGYVLGAGFEGRAVLQVDLSLDGVGPLADIGASNRARREIGALTGAVENARRLVEGAKTAEEKAARAQILNDYRTRLDALKAEAARPVPPDAKTFYSRSKMLGHDAPEDAVWAEKIRRLEEKHSVAH